MGICPVTVLKLETVSELLLLLFSFFSPLCPFPRRHFTWLTFVCVRVGVSFSFSTVCIENVHHDKGQTQQKMNVSMSMNDEQCRLLNRTHPWMSEAFFCIMPKA